MTRLDDVVSAGRIWRSSGAIPQHLGAQRRVLVVGGGQLRRIELLQPRLQRLVLRLQGLCLLLEVGGLPVGAGAYRVAVVGETGAIAESNSNATG